MQAWQFSAVASSSDEGACKSFYSEVFRGFLSLIFIGAAGLTLLSRLLTNLLLNSAYMDAWQYMPTLLCAAAFEAIVSFLATVYMVRKKSMHSFFTAMIGTLANVAINFCLIPVYGALGAAIATMVAYALVLVVRLVDAPRMIRFRLYLPRFCINAALLLACAAVMTFAPPLRLLWAVLLTAAIIAINAHALLSALKHLVAKRR